MSNNTNNNNFSKYKINKRNQNVKNSQNVSCIACNPKGEKPNIIVGFENGMIKLFNFTETGNFACVDTFRSHTNIVTCILFNPINPMIFVSCSIDESLILWNLMNNDVSRKIKINEISNDRSSKLIFNYDGSIICVRYDNYIGLYEIIFESSNENNSINISFGKSIKYNIINIGQNDNSGFFFHPNKNVLFIGFDDPNCIYIFGVNESLNQLTALLEFTPKHDIFSSCLNITGNILFLVDTNNPSLHIVDISKGHKKFEEMNMYDLTKYFDEYPDIIPLFHPKNPELLLLYDFFNIIILQIISSRIKCLYKYKHPTKITSCSFNFLGNAIIFSSDNNLVILELKLNIVNNNRLNRGRNTMRMLGNISISAS